MQEGYTGSEKYIQEWEAAKIGQTEPDFQRSFVYYTTKVARADNPHLWFYGILSIEKSRTDIEQAQIRLPFSNKTPTTKIKEIKDLAYWYSVQIAQKNHKLFPIDGDSTSPKLLQAKQLLGLPIASGEDSEPSVAAGQVLAMVSYANAEEFSIGTVRGEEISITHGFSGEATAAAALTALDTKMQHTLGLLLQPQPLSNFRQPK